MAIYLLKNNKYFLHSVKQIYYNIFFKKSKYIFTKISFFMAFFYFSKNSNISFISSFAEFTKELNSVSAILSSFSNIVFNIELND